jgi:hypothetical protein
LIRRRVIVNPTIITGISILGLLYSIGVYLLMLLCGSKSEPSSDQLYIFHSQGEQAGRVRKRWYALVFSHGLTSADIPVCVWYTSCTSTVYSDVPVYVQYSGWTKATDLFMFLTAPANWLSQHWGKPSLIIWRMVGGKGKADLFIAQTGRYICRSWRYERCFLCPFCNMYSKYMSTLCTLWSLWYWSRCLYYAIGRPARRVLPGWDSGAPAGGGRAGPGYGPRRRSGSRSRCGVPTGRGSGHGPRLHQSG